ncbi:MAG: hypothetical protein IJ333_08285 [Clostridia bacterium]|nr:hypothetical protein [Clostridia bacterium]
MKSIVAKICLLFLLISLCSCAKMNAIKDHYETDVLNEEIALEIAESIIFAGIEYDFLQEDTVPYEYIFDYFLYFGFFDRGNELREELKEYAADPTNYFETTYSIPAKIVDQYLTSKFYTKVDHKAIPSYNEKTDCYVLIPYTGDYYGDIQIRSIKTVEEDLYQIEVTEILSDTEKNDYTLEVSFHSDFKILSYSNK